MLTLNLNERTCRGGAVSFAKMQLICCCLLFFTAHGFAQYEDIHTANTFLQFANHRSNPRAIIAKNGIRRELIYDYLESAKGEMDSTLVAVIFYDESGNILEKWKGLNKDRLVEKYSYDVDALKRPALLKIAFNDPDNNLAGTEVEYDTLGREVNMYQYNKDTTSLLIRHKEYSSQGNLQVLYTKVDNDSFYLSHQYVNDVNGRLQAVNVLTRKEQLMYTYKYLYNASGMHLKVLLIMNDESKQVGEFLYDSAKRLVKVTVPDPFERARWIPSAEPDFQQPHYFHHYLDRMDTAPGQVHTYFIYNSNGTLYESHNRRREHGGKVYSLTRHYYIRE